MRRARVHSEAMRCLLSELAWSMQLLMKPSIQFFHLTENQLVAFAANPIKFNGKSWEVIALDRGQATIFWPGPGDASCAIVWVEKACTGRARDYFEVAIDSARKRGSPLAEELLSTAQRRDFAAVFPNQKLIAGHFITVTVSSL